MVKSSAAAKADAAQALERSTKQWRAAKKKERAARDELAQLVQNTVDAEILSESKIAQITDIPRMTIRKMLGKDAGAKKDD